MLGVVDFLGDGGGVVPAHVVPEADGDGTGDVRCGEWMGESSGAVAVSLPERDGDQYDEGREENAEHHDGALADDLCAFEVPEGAGDDDGKGPEGSAMALSPGGLDVAEVEDEDGGVDGHVKDTGGEGEPGFLESPERPKGAMDPDVEAAFGGDGTGEFADHERGGETPEEGDDGEHEESAQVAGLADDVFEAVRAAGDHEVGGPDEREQSELVLAREDGDGDGSPK